MGVIDPREHFKPLSQVRGMGSGENWNFWERGMRRRKVIRNLPHLVAFDPVREKDEHHMS